MAGSERVRREVVLPADRDEVWASLTRTERLSAWFGAEVEIDPRPRGVVTATDSNGAVRRGTVVAVNAPYRLVLVWDSPGGLAGPEEAPTRVEFTLEAVPQGTLLTVMESPLRARLSPRQFLLEAAR